MTFATLWVSGGYGPARTIDTRTNTLLDKISMVRVRKGKGASTAPAPTKSSGKAKSAQKSRSGDAVLQEQVLALGGTKADLDLVKNVKQTTTDGSLESDVWHLMNSVVPDLPTIFPAHTLKRCVAIPERFEPGWTRRFRRDCETVQGPEKEQKASG